MNTPQTTLEVDLEVENELEVSRTHKLSEVKIQGFSDELEALKQAIYKVLNTEKYEYPIYSFSYGIELESLIGKDIIYVKIELKRRIIECLMEDERIINVDNFNFIDKGDELLCTFDVTSIYGELDISKGVTI